MAAREFTQSQRDTLPAEMKRLVEDKVKKIQMLEKLYVMTV